MNNQKSGLFALFVAVVTMISTVPLVCAQTIAAASTIASIPARKPVKKPAIIEISTYSNGEAIVADAGTRLKYTLIHATPPPFSKKLDSYTEGMFSVISDGSNGSPVELRILPGYEGCKGKISIRCENELGTVYCWNQIFPNGSQPGLLLFRK